MARTNREVAEGLIEAVASQDLLSLLEFTDPEIEWRSFFAQLQHGGIYRGHDGIRQYLADLEDSMDLLQAEIDETLTLDDLILVVGRLRFRGKGSGVEDEAAVGYLLKVKEGRAVVLRAFRDPKGVLESIGE